MTSQMCHRITRHAAVAPIRVAKIRIDGLVGSTRISGRHRKSAPFAQSSCTVDAHEDDDIDVAE